MSNQLEIPKDMIEMLNRPDLMRAYMERVNQLSNPEIVFIDSTGARTRGTLDLSGKKAVITIRV